MPNAKFEYEVLSECYIYGAKIRYQITVRDGDVIIPWTDVDLPPDPVHTLHATVTRFAEEQMRNKNMSWYDLEVSKIVGSISRKATFKCTCPIVELIRNGCKCGGI